MAAPGASYVTKGDYAYARVREMILSGELQPGSRINQEALAVTIGLSTTPLREALRRLKTEGWVRLDAHSDARVGELSAAEAQNLFEVRRSLDPLAARLAAERRTDDDLATMRRTAEALRPVIGGADDAVLEAHRDFHAAIYRASHNDLLIEMLDGLWDKADRYRRFGLGLLDRSEARIRDYEEHFLLMQAIADSRAEEAESIMRDHVTASVTARAVEELKG